MASRIAKLVDLAEQKGMIVESVSITGSTLGAKVELKAVRRSTTIRIETQGVDAVRFAERMLEAAVRPGD